MTSFAATQVTRNAPDLHRPIPAGTTPVPNTRGISSGTVGNPKPAVLARAVRIDQAQYWVGSVLTAGIAAVAAVIGLVLAQDLLKLPVPLGSMGLAGAHIMTYGVVVGLVAVLAAGAYDGMLALAPRPFLYFSWIAGLLTALAVLLPFTAPVAVAAQIALAVVNLIVGVAILTLVPIAAGNADVR